MHGGVAGCKMAIRQAILPLSRVVAHELGPASLAVARRWPTDAVECMVASLQVREQRMAFGGAALHH
jgi:hypothetical protein